MTQRTPETIRNIVFCGHSSSGKTMLADKILCLTGAINRPASVEDGSSVFDFDDEEKLHKHSIECSLAHFSAHGKHFNLLDTPGYPDLIGQTLGAFRAAETAIIVINAHTGVQVNTRRVFQEAEREGLGRVIVLNKMDSDNVDFRALIEEIQSTLGQYCLPLNVPLGCGHDFRGVASTLHLGGDTTGAAIDPAELHDAILEDLVEVDDEVMAHYFDGQPPADAELPHLFELAIASGHLIPIVCTSAKTGVGVQELIDMLDLCALPPVDVPRKALDESGKAITLEPVASHPLVAQVFKTRIDPFVQKLSYLRIYSGTLHKDQSVHVSGMSKNIKIGPLLEVQGNETRPIDSAGPGDLVAIAKTDELHTGSTLGDYAMPAIPFPTPMVGLAAAPKNRGDEAKLAAALHKLVEEDSTFHLDRDPQTKELVMTGLSELHLNLLRERLKRRDRIELETHEPKIPYRETIQQPAEGSYRHKKQTGGRGQFGEVHIRLYPFPRGTKPEEFLTKERFPQMREYHYDPSHNFLWVDSIVGGSIPNNFLPAVEKGFKDRLDRGVIAGYGVQDLVAEVHFGKHHPVDSSEAAFKTAGSMAFRDVFQQAKPSLLEPIVTLHVTAPSDKLGDINSDLSTRRGRVLGMESAGGNLQTVTAQVPLAEVTTYARSLSSITGGQGSYSIELSHYDVVPGNVQRELVGKAVVHDDEEA